MNRLVSTIFVQAAALLLLVAGTAFAGVPDPTTSTVPCIVVCPEGDIPYVVVIRDAASNPVASSFVSVEFCSTGVEPCPNSTGCGASGITDASGRLSLGIKAGGVFPFNIALVRADGVLLRALPIASPDQNSDLVVDGADLAILQAKIGGPYDVTADLDCDGDLDSADEGILSAHLGEDCQVPTPGRSTTWGRIKTIYR